MLSYLNRADIARAEKKTIYWITFCLSFLLFVCKCRLGKKLRLAERRRETLQREKCLHMSSKNFRSLPIFIPGTMKQPRRWVDTVIESIKIDSIGHTKQSKKNITMHPLWKIVYYSLCGNIIIPYKNNQIYTCYGNDNDNYNIRNSSSLLTVEVQVSSFICTKISMQR